MTRLGNRRFDLDFGEEMLDDPRVMHGEASGDIITTAAQRRHEVSQSNPLSQLGLDKVLLGCVKLRNISQSLNLPALLPSLVPCFRADSKAAI